MRINVVRSPGSHRRALGVCVLGVALALSSPVTFAGGNQAPGLPDFDARDAFERDARPNEGQAAQLEQLRRSGVRVAWDDRFGTPRMIVRDGGFITEPSDASPEASCLHSSMGASSTASAAVGNLLRISF